MAPGGNPHLPKAATQAEVVAVARRLRQRLSRHLDALETGEIGAVDDLAAVLRTLLAHGKGDDAIVRLCHSHKLPLPQVRVSLPVADDQKIGLAFGAIPAPDEPGHPPTVVMDIDRWRGLDALIIKGAPRRVNSWEQLITEYANTYGSHLSGTIPHLLSHASSMGYSGNLDVGEYLIHCAGLVAEDALQQVLKAIDGDAAQPPGHRLQTPLTRLTVETKTPPSIEAGYNVLDRPFGQTLQIAKLRVDGMYFMLELTRAAADETTFHWDFTRDKPEWWDGSDN
ncbi:hypothetical protein [Mycobacterium gordonae]|uniref:Uncharacterized protein n=1 Tax=Mycobacterium gordonae TaxID=1778 RepID=A0A1X1X178_MYCGO|nr:hypothetical protein [Mycobacterium gordonae]MCV7008232.1 hypothetical protein [Mycobacterium gordonae]ODR16907.1 hypothetical protein BHQ23_28315 [Mycobacterium gordonae]ORV92634.1 hypothetical protein AWC08_19215 [Mycobacterium gordonae]